MLLYTKKIYPERKKALNAEITMKKKPADHKRRRDKGDRHFCLPSLRSALRYAPVTKDPVPVCPGCPAGGTILRYQRTWGSSWAALARI